MSNKIEEETLVVAEDNDEKQLSTRVIPAETVPDKVEETGVEDATETMDVETTGVDATNNSTTMDTSDEAGVGSSIHGLRPRRATNYSRHMHGASTSKKTGYTLAHLQKFENVAMAQHAASEGVRNIMKLEHMALTKYSVKKGIKVFGEEGTQFVISDMKQLDSMYVIETMEARTMTRVEKRSALEYLIFLKKKRCGRIKGHGCFNGRKQQGHMTKEETRLPTVSTEGLLLFCTINAQEERDMATTYIPGVFMQTDVNDTVYV